MPTDGPARPTRGATPVNNPLNPPSLHISSNVVLVVIFNALSGSFSICRRVFATSSGHVAADAKVPATKPAEKFAPRIVAALGSSPTSPRIFFLIGSRVDQQIAENGTSLESCAPSPVHQKRYLCKF